MQAPRAAISALKMILPWLKTPALPFLLLVMIYSLPPPFMSGLRVMYVITVWTVRDMVLPTIVPTPAAAVSTLQLTTVRPAKRQEIGYQQRAIPIFAARKIAKTGTKTGPGVMLLPMITVSEETVMIHIILRDCTLDLFIADVQASSPVSDNTAWK